ncbi:MAG TPA: carbohydrate ABC transporter permease [Candidatus Latescibacteria bacterium]|nr:carbohydrate ABC transporter permease [Candidatus Latescibacterota bacterium]
MKLKAVMLNLFLISGGVFMVLPFIWMFSTSFKPTDEILSWPPRLLPRSWTLEHYRELFEWPFGRFFLNSLLVATLSTLSILATSSLAGFVFAKYKFFGRNLIFFLFLATAMVPFQCFMVPFYITLVKLHLVNTYLGIVLPMLVMSYGIFFMRQNISSIPDELIDAARIDGCSEFGIYLRVVLPLSKPAMSALGIFAFMSAWGSFIWPLVITNTKEKFVLEVGLAMFQHRFFIDYGSTTAGATVAVLPVLLVFFVLRRNLIEGITLTGLKG